MKRCLLLLVLVVAVVVQSFAQNLHIKFYNKTGHTVDSLVVGKTYVGKILADSSSDDIAYPEIVFFDDKPIELLTCISEGKRIENYVDDTGIDSPGKPLDDG